MPIIRNYGFLWEKKYIFRGVGGQGNGGHLKGTARGKNDADFFDQIGVYVLYDRNESIVYVGQAGNGNATLFSRLKSHMTGPLRDRWEYFTWIGFRGVNGDGSLDGRQTVEKKVAGFTYGDALNEVEGILIEVIEPKLNKQGGRLRDATEYYQYIDERLEEASTNDLRHELEKIHKRLDSL